MKFTAKQIAEMIGGRIEGNPEAAITTFAKIEEGQAGAISFLYDAKYVSYIYTTASTIVLINEDITLDKPVSPTLIRVKNARESVARLLQVYESMNKRKTGIHPTAVISQSATLGKDIFVGPYAVIGDNVTIGDNCTVSAHAVIDDDVTIGDNCTFYPHVTVYHGCKFGNNITVHASTVIGADGFGFEPTPEGYVRIPQIGIVVIEDDVEIGANACIDRASMGQTIVHRGVKVDNLVQIAHNVEVGANTVMSAQTGVAGTTKIGEWCMFGGQVGLAGHMTVGDHVNLGAQTGANNSLEGNQTLMGTPPMPFRQYFKSNVIFRRLPDMAKQLDAMQKDLDALKEKLAAEL